jgi:hypothetical protein
MPVSARWCPPCRPRLNVNCTDPWDQVGSISRIMRSHARQGGPAADAYRATIAAKTRVRTPYFGGRLVLFREAALVAAQWGGH